MIRRATLLAFALFVPSLAVPRPLPAEQAPSGPAVTAALAYAAALGGGDYAKAYGMLTDAMQRYFGNVANYASVWKADRYSIANPKAVKTKSSKDLTLVALSAEVGFFDHGAQTERQGRVVLPFVVARERGGYRIDDEGHPYRSFVPPDASVDHDGAKVAVRKLSFFGRRIECTVTFENHGESFITFLPYGRTVLRDEQNVYRLFETRDWLLTDRRLFEGLRLAAPARYSGTLNFQADHRLDDRARTFSLTVAPALREGGEKPLEFALPPIAVPAP